MQMPSPSPEQNFSQENADQTPEDFRNLENKTREVLRFIDQKELKKFLQKLLVGQMPLSLDTKRSF
jgi:hypothetical protein